MIGQDLVKGGTHWPADDPLVLANPTLFSADPRFGLFSTLSPEQIDSMVEPAAVEAPREKRSYIRRNPDSLRVE